MKLRYLPLAVDELEKNALWLDEHAGGRGREFLDVFAATIAQIRKSPKRFPRFEAALQLAPDFDVRRATLKPFPHLTIFELRSNSILIVAVMHPSQHPGYWVSRLRR